MGANTHAKLCLLLNVCSSVGIVWMNKFIYTFFGFPNVPLTCVHLLMTSIGLLLCHQLNIFQPKRLPLQQMIPLSLAFCCFITFTNLSLEANTTPTYQLFKTLTTPCSMLFQIRCYHKITSTKGKLAVIPIILGVLLNSVVDPKVNSFGIGCAILGVVATSVFYVWLGEKQSEYQVNTLQLLYYQAPLSALTLIFVSPFITSGLHLGTMFVYWPLLPVIMALLSGLLAFLVNLSTYWLLGSMSQEVYIVAGHVKFLLTLVGGIIIFKESLNFLQVLAICITLAGVLLYSKVKDEEKKKANIPMTVTSVSQ